MYFFEKNLHPNEEIIVIKWEKLNPWEENDEKSCAPNWRSEKEGNKKKKVVD